MNIDFISFLQKFTEDALAEDIRTGDYTTLSTIPLEAEEEAVFIIKEEGVLAGVEVAKEMLSIIDPEVVTEILIKDGSDVQLGDRIMRIRGSVHTILKSERLLLNVMQRMSGIATKTRKYVHEVAHTKAKILDTRKTSPLLRFLEKKAVQIGGGENHRFGLYDMILIKDNHIDYAGGIRQALHKTYQYIAEKALQIPVEIEVRDFEELEEVLQYGKVDRIMLDNFTPEDIKTAIERIKGLCEIEASGGINFKTIKAYAETGVDYISIGDLTHSIKSLDISLKANS